MLAGIDQLARVSGLTLGPAGRNVALVPRDYAEVRVVNRADIIVQALSLPDPLGDLGVKLVRQAAAQTERLAGDGSTTTILLSHAMIRDGYRLIAAGANPMLLRRGITRAADAVAQDILRTARSVEDYDQIAKLATTSSGDPKIGEVVAQAMERVGKYGLITLERSIETTPLKLQFREGLQYDRGYLSSYFCTDGSDAVALNNARVLLTDAEIQDASDLTPVLERLSKAGATEFLVVAGEVGGEALTLLTANNAEGKIRCVAIRAPEVSQYRVDVLEDLAIWTGGKYIRKEMGSLLPYLEVDDLGRVGKAFVEAGETTLVGGRGDPERVTQRIEEIRRQAAATEDDFQREKMNRRVAQLTGGIAIIWYGGATEAERNDRRYRLDDALASTRSAMKEGLVAGGGLALVAAQDVLDELDGSDDERMGIDIVGRSLQAPLRQIASNAGDSGSVVLAMVRRQQHERGTQSIGYDARSREYIDVWEAGILDTAASVRHAVVNAASCAAMLLTTEATIVDPYEAPRAEGKYQSAMDYYQAD